MADRPPAPADTTMMRIVHDALRRDLRRVSIVLDTDPPADDRQRAAVAEQLAWVLAFLEAHHRAEDLGLYPLVRRRDPTTSALLDDLARDHDAVATAAADVASAAGAWAADGDAAPALAAALDALTAFLVPHLRREEDDAMPVVARLITDDEWRALEQEHNLDGKPTAQLAREGHWLIDGAAAEDRARVLGLVPPLPRAVLRYGYGPAYRRRARACWRPRRRVQWSGTASTVVPADLDAVWDVVRDPTRVGEWSHECVRAEWLAGATEARPGARFRGRNGQGVVRWGRVCEVVQVVPHELVWRTVPTMLYPDSTVWSLRLEATPGGTRIEQTFQVVKGSWLEPLYATLVPAHRERTEALTRDLERIGAVAGAAAISTPRSAA